jgi:hypothetical protein
VLQELGRKSQIPIRHRIRWPWGGSPTEVRNCAAKADRDRPAAQASASSVQSFAGASWMHARARAMCELRSAENQLPANGDSASFAEDVKAPHCHDESLLCWRRPVKRSR